MKYIKYIKHVFIYNIYDSHFADDAWIGVLARDAACNNITSEHGATPCSGHAPLCPMYSI